MVNNKKKYKKKGRLCNQGCGTRLYFAVDESGKKRPYNILDKEKHVCPMMEMSKMYGGKWNTIPLSYIKREIIKSFEALKHAHRDRTIDTILSALDLAVDNLQNVVWQIEQQEYMNKEYAGKLDGYKKKLVEDQERREEQEEEEVNAL